MQKSQISRYNRLPYRLTRRLEKTASLIFKLALLFVFLFPFYWMIITAFKTYTESILFPPTLWPKTFTIASFVEVFSKMNLWHYLKNSLIITFSVITIQTLVTVPAAYAFARYEFKGKKIMWALVMLAFMVPNQITFITVYIMMARLRLLSTLLPQILPFGANAFGIFMLRQNFKQIPEEIVEAARLDNAGEIKIMCKVMLPMAKSNIITVTLFSFVTFWNSYFWPLVMTDNDKVRPLTLAIERMKDAELGLNWPTLMAGNTILMVPILIIFVLLAKKIFASMGYRGVK